MPIMSRKAISTHPDVKIAIEKIKRHCTSNRISTLALAKNARVSQPALARFLKGERKTLTPVASATLSHIDNWHNRHNEHKDAILGKPQKIDQEGYRLIIEAIESMWDGQYQSAQLIASLVVALKPTLEIAANINAAGQKGS
jgi:hypothetical protein